MGDLWYLGVGLLLFLALEGWLFPRSRSWVAPRGAIAMMGLWGGVAFGGWLLVTFGTQRFHLYAHGRYLFPVAIPLAGLVIGGWGRWVPGGWAGIALLV